MSSEKTLRILRIIARLNVGGPAIQAITLTSEFSDEKYQTVLVCGNVGPNEGDMAYLAGGKSVQPFIIPELGREISAVDDFKAFVRLRKIIKRFRPHIIHTHTAKAGTLGRLAAASMNIFSRKEDRIWTVHTFHGHVFHSYFNKIKSFLYVQIERVMAVFTDRIVVISDLQRKDICDRFRIAHAKKVRVIPLGFDLSVFEECGRYRKEMRQKYLSGEKKDVFLVGIIGRLTPIKDHSLFLKAIKILMDQGEGALFKFIIVGDGELKTDLIHEARRLNVHEKVIFAGWQKDMKKIYGAFDAVALTSKNEGTPVTIIEAMAAEKPVVATDVGGLKDLLGEAERDMPGGFKLAENGILVRSQDAKALASAFLFLRKNSGVSSPSVKRAKEFVFRKYSIVRLIDDLKALYSELVEPRVPLQSGDIDTRRSFSIK